MGTVADYDHLTALMAPRATLLTFNAKDDCCFVSGYALPPLLESAGPFFQLYGKRPALRPHVNNVPGTHNYEKDNREAFYRMIGEHFYPGDKTFSADEIDCAKEVRKAQDLRVPLPAGNASFNSLARELGKALPNQAALPDDKKAAAEWLTQNRVALRKLIGYRKHEAKADSIRKEMKDGVAIEAWRLRLDDDWTMPVVDCNPGGKKGTVIRLHDDGRAALPVSGERRVVVADPLGFGEAQGGYREYLWALMVATVGERALGVQSSQVGALARWLQKQEAGPITLVAEGPRSSVIALVAAAMEPDAIQSVEVRRSLGSLKEILEQNMILNDVPELFCYGLLETLDLKHIAALCAPRPVGFLEPSDRARSEMAGLKTWYRTWGQEMDPLK
jgi:hypothetical protein